MMPKLQKIIYHGDIDLCRRSERAAKKNLGKLYESLAINADMQGWRPITPLLPGVDIRLHIGLTTDTIEIYAYGGEAQEPTREEEKAIRKECLCTCNMSIGKVADRVLSGTPGTPYENLGLEEAPFYIYRVNVCQRKFTYVAFDNVLGCDFTPWEVGQKVSVLAYNAFLFGCCLPDPAVLGVNFLMFSATACEGQVTTLTDMSDYDWRTTYRISQICALPRPYWVEYDA